MRVAFVLKDLQLSGGVGVVVEHAAGLREGHGVDARIVLDRAEDRPRWPYRRLAEVPVMGLAEAQAERWDVAISTWWETTFTLFTLPAGRYCSFVQDLEDSFVRPDSPERAATPLALALPVRFITEAGWIAEYLEALQPGNVPLLVRNGIDKELFAPVAAPVAPSTGEPLRVVIEGGDDAPRKGTGEAFAAVRRMTAPAHVTWVSPRAPEAVPERVDRLLTGLSHAQMAELFAETHVLLKLSRAEGMYGPPLEAFHRGATVVTTAVTGHEEYVRHRDNGLVVGWDDPGGTARALDLLARDRGLLGRLRESALATARAWPGWPQQVAEMAAALRRVVAEPPPPAAAAGLRAASELQTVIAELQRRDRDLENAHRYIAQIESQRAWLWAKRVRRQVHRYRRLRGRLSGGRC